MFVTRVTRDRENGASDFISPESFGSVCKILETIVRVGCMCPVVIYYKR